MAKEKKNGSAKADQQTSTTEETRGAAPPAGYKRQSSDVVGYWDVGAGPIHFVPRTVKMFDSNLESAKPTILVIGVLVEACKVLVKDDDTGEMTQATADRGDTVGVWYKPGMRAITNLCDAKVWMYQSGERKTGKPNPMKLFSVSSPGPNKRFDTILDEREESYGVSTDFGGPREGGPARRSSRTAPARGGYTRDPDAADVADEDIPF